MVLNFFSYNLFKVLNIVLFFIQIIIIFILYYSKKSLVIKNEKWKNIVGFLESSKISFYNNIKFLNFMDFLQI